MISGVFLFCFFSFFGEQMSILKMTRAMLGVRKLFVLREPPVQSDQHGGGFSYSQGSWEEPEPGKALSSVPPGRTSQTAFRPLTSPPPPPPRQKTSVFPQLKAPDGGSIQESDRPFAPPQNQDGALRKPGRAGSSPRSRSAALSQRGVLRSQTYYVDFLRPTSEHDGGHHPEAIYGTCVVTPVFLPLRVRLRRSWSSREADVMMNVKHLSLSRYSVRSPL
ncbi:uncharacterized protein LOC129378778 isoform X1 [Poeciliopsis prolifica]|uniref:uncharacterized protein LOC129378778 isoform X1 n=1 Tax=Poeciliopsis prolifica TaxID=188132 RepID=UPI0024141435|nr:uncharacterized protein LOC129378778 isoform X1 [Poeciliopsis prolifica]